MIDRVLRPVVALLAVPALVACSAIGDIRRDPPSRSAAPSPTAVTVPAPPPSAGFDEVRAGRVAVAERYDDPFVEFSDAAHGWALFASCDGGPPDRTCPALLFSTLDGGRSWLTVRHPRPVADNQQLYTAPGLVTLLAEPHGWYTSTDGGASFVRTDGEPPAWRAAQGRFQVIEATGRVGEWDGAALRPLAAQPSVPASNTVASSADLLVAAGVGNEGPYAAVSTDRGRSWQRTPVPAPDGTVAILRAEVAPDSQVWLVGERSDRMDFPALWRWQGRWTSVPAQSYPSRILSVAPIGAGRVAVTGPYGAGVVIDGRYTPVPWPVGPEHYLTTLDDGTVFARGPADVVLGTGVGTDRRWVRVTVGGD
ncbi:hypothetical protein [Micromonospora sp. 4G55]|uniref:hypothetical protein n=1 Tax=Micromonospora sp. 4G55 TaxID=2806102 RepID=UPI001A5385C7|nr:hypothetical protein [Micromonospora sp. 4G55]MBM0257453.1 hypothetical protein [Micromonospora sp. 4G55]